MKKILCFGDSNVFGFNPNNFKRYKNNEYWASILKNKLYEHNFTIDGCNNRTIFSNPQKELNSLELIKDYSLADYDLIIYQIGINDLQFSFNNTIETFSKKLDELINLTKQKTNSRIILLCPNEIDECILKSYFAQLFDRSSIEKSKSLVNIYKTISEKYSCNFIDLNKHTKTSAIDGLHFDNHNHQIIADVLSDVIYKLFK